MILLLLACGAPAEPPPLLDPAVALMTSLDADGSGLLEPAELHPPGTLALTDADGSGTVSLDELRAHLDRWPPDQQLPEVRRKPRAHSPD